MARHAPAYFRAVAVDFDGTLADGPVTPGTLAVLAEARARQIRVILVTGRIMSELQAVFPQVEQHVDAIVAENGAVLSGNTGSRLLAAPVSRAVSSELAARGVAHRRGQALVACAAADEPSASAVIRELGLDCQLVRNRGELMILPAGITKGTGLTEALNVLGLSRHNAIGVGDGENDHSLLDACEVGVAVANAVGAIRAHADVVLGQPDGAGVAELLRGPLLASHACLHSRRWQLALGTDDHGEPVTVPASQLNIVICGDTGNGKSYLTGLLLEQLIALGYCVIVCDPEGDHRGLGELPGVYVTGGHEGHLTDPADVVRLLRQGYASVVIDLSHLDAAGQAGYEAQLAGEIEAHRATTGLPQWVVLDEAHGPVGRNGAAQRLIDPAGKGYLLVTWQPEDLSVDALAAVDAVITLGSPDPARPFVDLTAAVAGLPRPDIARLLSGPPGRAVLAWREHPRGAVAFTLGSRSTPHLRHAHKYGQCGVESAHWFRFRTEPGIPTGAVAVNLTELEAELARCEEGVLRHHCPAGDFSRWVSDVFRDRALAASISAAEASLPPCSPGAVVDQVRLALIAALQERHVR